MSKYTHKIRSLLIAVGLIALLFNIAIPASTASAAPVAQVIVLNEYKIDLSAHRPWPDVNVTVLNGFPVDMGLGDVRTLKSGLLAGKSRSGVLAFYNPTDQDIQMGLQYECRKDMDGGEWCDKLGFPQFIRSKDLPEMIPAQQAKVFAMPPICPPRQDDEDYPDQYGTGVDGNPEKCETPPPPAEPECKTLDVELQNEGLPIKALLTVQYNDPDNQVLGVRWVSGDGEGGYSRIDVLDPILVTYHEPGKYLAQAWLVVGEGREITSQGCTFPLEIKGDQPPPEDTVECLALNLTTSGEIAPVTVGGSVEVSGTVGLVKVAAVNYGNGEIQLIDMSNWKVPPYTYTKPGNYAVQVVLTSKDGERLDASKCQGKVVVKKRPDQPPPVVEKDNPFVQAEFGIDCRSTGPGTYSVWAYGRVVSTKDLERLVGIMGQQNGAYFFGPDPDADSNHTAWLEMNDTLAIQWVKAPALNTGPTFFGNVIGKDQVTWWPKVGENEKAWYDKERVYEERYGWGYSVFGQDNGQPLMWQYEPLSFPSREWLVERGCLVEPKVDNPPENKAAPVLERCPDRVEAAPIKGAEGQDAVDAQTPHAQLKAPANMLSNGHAFVKWLGQGCELPTWDVGQHRRDDTIVMSGHYFGIFARLHDVQVGDHWTYIGEDGVERTIEATASRPTQRGGSEYTHPEQLGADVTMFTCFDPVKINGKWHVTTSWLVTWKFVD